MATAHRFVWHGTGRSLLEAKLTAIAAAQSSVVMETFIFRDSDIGQRFRDALTAAARRGVRVRLLVDRVGSFQLKRDYFDGLLAAGGAMRWFNELRLPSFSFRDHRKLLIVDGLLAFVGGCNIAPEYWGDGITTGWRDGGVSVHGRVAGVLEAEFDRQWERAVEQRWKFPTGGFSQRVRVKCGTEVQVLFIKPGLGRNHLCEYSGYLDHTSNYVMKYYTGYLAFNEGQTSVILKKIATTVIGGLGQTINFKCAFDYSSNFRTQSATIETAYIAYYGVSMYNQPTSVYSAGIFSAIPRVNIGGAGKVLQIGFETVISGQEISIQRFDIYTKSGKIL